MSEKYKRILVKISGEEFAGDQKIGIQADFLSWVANEIKSVADEGIEVVVIVGGGNYVRGADYEKQGIERGTADHMGMLSGVINGLALHDTVKALGQPVKIMSSLDMQQVAEPFIRRKAAHYLDKGNVLIVVAGTGRPYFTHDTAGVMFALDLECDVMLKATKVDGVYDKNPTEHVDAHKFDTVDFQTAIEKPEIRVMDKAALGLAMEQDMPVVVFKLRADGNLRRVALGENIGTSIVKNQ